MGMFDSFEVERNNKQGIVYEMSGYQSKDFDCQLTTFNIDKEGVLSYIQPISEMAQLADSCNRLCQEVTNGGFTGSISLTGCSLNGADYIIYVKNNQVAYVYDERKGEIFVDDESLREMYQDAIKSEYLIEIINPEGK